MKTIYLDYNATTPIDPEVLRAMEPYFTSHYGNPSSIHSYGRPARAAIEQAREQIAALAGCAANEIYFTSGASESNNTIIKGVAWQQREKGKHLITTRIDHPSVVEPCRFLERQGYRVTYLGVDSTGMVDPASVEKAITSETILISIMHANNEIGTIQPISEIGTIARSRGVLFHSDAAQTAGKIPVSAGDMNVDFLSLAGHKIYAPKGTGALYVRNGVTIEPLIHGARQERGLRSGTENVLWNIALGKACELAQAGLADYGTKVRELRDYFQQKLTALVGDRIVVNGHPLKRLPNTLHVSFRGITGVDLLEKTAAIAASTGAACHSGQISLSATLKAIGVSEDLGAGSVRFSLGKSTTKTEVDEAIRLIADVFSKQSR